MDRKNVTVRDRRNARAIYPCGHSFDSTLRFALSKAMRYPAYRPKSYYSH